MRLLTLLIFTSSLFASTEQWVCSGLTQVLTNNAVNYHVISGDWPNGGATATLDARTQNMFATSGKSTKFFGALAATAGGGAKEYILTAMKNGSASPITITLATTALVQDYGHIVRWAIGDLVSIRTDPNSSTPTSVAASFCMNFIPDVPGETVMFAQAHTFTATTTHSLAYVNSAGTTNVNNLIPMPCAGTFTRIAIYTPVGTGGTGSVAAAVEKNSGGASTMSVTANNVTSVQTSTANRVSMVAGDTLDLAITLTGTPTSGDIYEGLVFVPSTIGQFILPSARNGSSTGPANNATNYIPAIARDNAFGASQAAVQTVAPPVQVQAMYVVGATTGNASNGYQLILQKAGSDTAIVTPASGSSCTTGSYCSASGTTTANITGQAVNFNQGDLINLESKVLGTTPGNPAPLAFGILAYIAPTDSHFFTVLQ